MRGSQYAYIVYASSHWLTTDVHVIYASCANHSTCFGVQACLLLFRQQIQIDEKMPNSVIEHHVFTLASSMVLIQECPLIPELVKVAAVWQGVVMRQRKGAPREEGSSSQMRIRDTTPWSLDGWFTSIGTHARTHAHNTITITTPPHAASPPPPLLCFFYTMLLPTYSTYDILDIRHTYLVSANKLLCCKGMVSLLQQCKPCSSINQSNSC